MTTLYRARGGGEAWLKDLPILGTTLEVRHADAVRSVVYNTGSRRVVWRAAFAGSFSRATIERGPAVETVTDVGRRTTIGVKTRILRQQKDKWGHVISYVDVLLGPGEKATVAILPR